MNFKVYTYKVLSKAGLMKRFFRINEKSYFIKFRNSNQILIFDDFLPSALSPWRSFEFNEICNEFPQSKIKVDLSSYHYYNSNKTYKENYSILKELYPSLVNKLFKLNFFNIINSKLGYVLFYNNIKKYHLVFIENKINYFFTLYPGGGFQLYNSNISDSLRIICSSSYFKGVIVNQHITKEYLLNEGICGFDKIHLFHGIPLNLKIYDSQIIGDKDFYGKIKILFMANKYTKDGTDKGFPAFVEFANKVIKSNIDIEFHIIGDFGESDIQEVSIINYFKFHGQLSEQNFGNVLNETQLIISPNIPFILSPGAFDGFPLGTSVTAGYFNNAMFLTDYFSESEKEAWIDGRHFIKILPDADQIFESVFPYLLDREKLMSLAYNGKNKIMEHYSFKKQIEPRIKLFSRNV